MTKVKYARPMTAMSIYHAQCILEYVVIKVSATKKTLTPMTTTPNIPVAIIDALKANNIMVLLNRLHTIEELRPHSL